MTGKKDKKITKVDILKSINRSFSRIEEKMATKEDLKNLATKAELEGIKKEIESVKDRLEGTNKRIDDYAETKVSKIVHKELENRVGFAEKKLEIKK